MKVLQVLPELTSGGVEMVTVEFARYLANEGHESLVLSHGGPLTQRLQAEGSRHLTLPVHRKNPLSLRLVPTLKRLILSEQPDIIHLRSRVPAWLVYLAWKQIPAAKRPRLISTVHGFYSVNFYSTIMTKGERVLCVSKSIQDYVLTNYPKTDPKKLQVIYEGIDTDRYHPDFSPSSQWRQDWQQEFPNSQDKILLTLPGRITRLKGHRKFLEVIAALRADNPRIHGIIAGGAHPKKKDYLTELKALTEELGLSEHITFTGARSDLREILSVSNLVFSLSTQPESFGLTVLEALSVGTPVIAYQQGGAAEILQELFPAGLCPLPDTNRSITDLLTQSQEILSVTPDIKPNQIFQSSKVHAQTLACYQSIHLAQTPS